VKLFRTLALAAVATVLALGAQAQAPAAAPIADPAATPATKLLLANLHRLLPRGVMYGHQDDLAYGIAQAGKMWKGDANRSDVKSTAGAYPAVFGWELGHLELDSARNLDGVPFAKIRSYVQQAYTMGAVNTISWHLDNPHNGKSAWDTTRTVPFILPGGPDHAKFVARLDRLAAFLGSLKGRRGEAIPVIFRPFHEHTGSWFWWGKKECTPAEFTALWRFTVDYLHNQKKLHNLIIAYSASDFTNEADYLERYPGDAYADVLGFDDYVDSKAAAKFQPGMARKLALLTSISKAHGKLPALTEVGYDGVPDPAWWTKTLLPLLKQYPVSYALTWRNGDPVHFYTAYPGQASAADFKQFFQDKQTFFANRLGPLRLYAKPI